LKTKKTKGGKILEKERRAVTEREARLSRVKEQKKLKPKEQNRGGKLSEKREEQRLGGHCIEEKKDRSSPPLCFLSTATTAPSSCHYQCCQCQQNQRGRRETEQK
jgi:hypothetical protein